MPEPQTAEIVGVDLEEHKPVLFQGYEIEPRAYRHQLAYSHQLLTNKSLFLFNESQDRLVKAGYESHLSLKSQFSVIIPYLEDRLEGEQPELAEDMLSSFGELSNQANEVTVQGILKKKQTLTFFEGVTRLDYDGNKYLKESIQFSSRTFKFNVSDLKLGNFHYFKNIYKKHNHIIEHSTGRIFEQLPERMQEQAGIYLQEPEQIVPVGRGGNDIGGGFGVNGYNYSGYGASRGGRSAHEKISQPTLEEVLQLDGEFVPNYAKDEHKKRLTALWNNYNLTSKSN